jgi:hypothetical protein
VATWAEFANAAPDLAAFARERIAIVQPALAKTNL